MASSLSNSVNNISEGIYRIKRKIRRDNEKLETCGIKYNYWDCFLAYANFKDDLIEYKYLCCNSSWTMSQKLPVNNVEWIEDTSQFNRDFIKNCNRKSDEGYFLEVDVFQYLEKLHELINDLPFLPETMEIEKLK